MCTQTMQLYVSIRSIRSEKKTEQRTICNGEHNLRYFQQHRRGKFAEVNQANLNGNRNSSSFFQVDACWYSAGVLAKNTSAELHFAKEYRLAIDVEIHLRRMLFVVQDLLVDFASLADVAANTVMTLNDDFAVA